MRKVVLVLLALMLLLTGCTHRYGDTGLSENGYVFGEDHQAWNRFGSASSNCFTKAEGGYYYHDTQTNLITYYDSAAQVALPLCSQPDCKHDAKESDCSAFIPYEFHLHFLQYYHGHLYALGTDMETENELSVYRISTDGTVRKKLGSALSVEGGAICQYLIHRGYVYFTPYGGGMTKSDVQVYRFPLTGKGETELIYSAKSKPGGTMLLNAWGNYLYLHYSYFTNAGGSGYTGTVYRYQIHEGTLETVLEGIWRDFAVDETNLYYDDGSKVRAHHLQTGEETLLAEPGMPVYLSCVEGVLCYDNGCGLFINNQSFDQRSITVIDTATFEVLFSVPLEGKSSEFVGTDGENLIAKTVAETDDGWDVRFQFCSLTGERWTPLS